MDLLGKEVFRILNNYIKQLENLTYSIDKSKNCIISTDDKTYYLYTDVFQSTFPRQVVS